MNTEIEVFVPTKMIERAKNSENGAVWYTDKGPVFISISGQVIPLFGDKNDK